MSKDVNLLFEKYITEIALAPAFGGKSEDSPSDESKYKIVFWMVGSKSIGVSDDDLSLSQVLEGFSLFTNFDLKAIEQHISRTIVSVFYCVEQGTKKIFCVSKNYSRLQQVSYSLIKMSMQQPDQLNAFLKVEGLDITSS